MRIFFDAVNGELAPRVTHLHRCTVRTRFAHTAAGIELHERESPWGFDNVKGGYGGVVFTTAFSITSKSLIKLERAKGFEPSTPTLARLCSTPELRPLWRPEDKSLSAGEAGN